MAKLVYCKCPECAYDAVLEVREMSYICPLCVEDIGRDVVMRERPVSEAPDKVEGHDARTKGKKQ